MREWTDEEKRLVDSALSAIRPRIDEMRLPWPETIYLIKTSGNEEGGAAYTRGSAIVLPETELAQVPKDSLSKMLSHELFHVLTRKNPALKITTPDAPKNDHCIRLQVAGVPTWAMPILFSRTSRYDTSRGGEFFDYLQFKFLLVEGKDSIAPVIATYDDANIRLVGLNEVSGFFEQIGRNTNYVIHPEEILADNFALLVAGGRVVPSPDVLRKMKETLLPAESSVPR